MLQVRWARIGTGGLKGSEPPSARVRALALILLASLLVGCANAPEADSPAPTTITPSATSAAPRASDTATVSSPSPTPGATEAPPSCSPRGTPTCSPEGHPVTPPGGMAPAPTSSPSLPRVEATLRTWPLTGIGPQGLDVDAATGLVYVANNGNVIAGCTGDVSQPGHDPATGMEPPREGLSTLSIVDPETGEVARVPTGAAPIWPLVDAARGVVRVANSGDGTMTLHALADGALVGRVELGGKPHAIGQSPSGILVVSNTNDASQTYYAVVGAQNDTLLAHHEGPELNHGIAWDEREGVFYLVGVKDGTVNVIDGETGATLASFAGSTDGFGNSNMLAFSAESRRLFVSDTKATHVVTMVDVDTRERVGTISFGQGAASAWGMQVDDTSGLLYVALPNADAIGVADATTGAPLALVPVGECPYAVRLDTTRGLGYSTGMVEDDLTVIDLRAVEAALGR